MTLFSRRPLTMAVLSALAVTLLMLAGLSAARAADTAKAVPAAAPADQGPFWTVRCTKPDDSKDKKAAAAPKECEVFQRLSVRKTGQRVAELAIGFPNKDHDAARGVLILPLGVLLTEDLQMQVDNGAAFKFKVRYCTELGCFAYLDLNKDALGVLRNGKELTIMAKAFSGQDVNIKLELDGLDKTLKKI